MQEETGSRGGIRWIGLAIAGWLFIDQILGQLIKFLPPAVSVGLGYLLWLVVAAALSWVFIFSLRRFAHAPSSVWIGVLIWNVIRVAGVAAVWFLTPDISSMPNAGMATFMSLLRSVVVTAVALLASNADADSSSAEEASAI